MPLHYEALDAERNKVWRKLAEFKQAGYLAGGTALALQIGHRISYDFDVFCPKPVTALLARKITRASPSPKPTRLTGATVGAIMLICILSCATST